mmetsp:Transcript_2525/g.5880  ORF Transcript_2525/g.5880 Transcript_2525/m.5880 type:complete len:329 (+) Transcript_2525:57-1043(+)
MAEEGGGAAAEAGGGGGAGGSGAPAAIFRISVRLIGASGLKSVQMFGVQDPFVEFQCAGKKKKSKTHFDGGVDPKWPSSSPFVFENISGVHMAENDLWIVIKDHGSFGSDSQIGWSQIPLKSFVDGHKETENYPVTSDGEIHGTIELEIQATQTSGTPVVASSKPGTAHVTALKGALQRAGSMGAGLVAGEVEDTTSDESDDEVEDYGYVYVESLKGERSIFDCGNPWKLRYLHLYNAENLRVYEFKDDIRTHCKPRRAYNFYSGIVTKGIRPGAPYPYVLKIDFKSRVGNRDVGTLSFSCTQERQMDAWYNAMHECFEAAPIVRDDV